MSYAIATNNYIPELQDYSHQEELSEGEEGYLEEEQWKEWWEEDMPLVLRDCRANNPSDTINIWKN